MDEVRGDVEAGGRKKFVKVLIIAIVVVLLIIAGWVIYQAVKKTSEDITDITSSSDLEILEAALIENETVQIIVQRNSRKGDLVGINFNISDGQNFTIIRVNTTMQKKDNETFIFSLAELSLVSFVSVSIAPIYLTAEGEEVIEIVGETTDTSTVSSGGGGGGSSGGDNGDTPVSPTCDDGIQNQAETGVDCGGSCDACATTYLRTFYVSTSGNDENSGTTPVAAWQTLSKVNSETFSPGDAILFKKGDVWRETLTVPSSGNTTHYITFGNYGSGDKPKILGSVQAITWTNTIGNVWESATVVNNPYSGDQAEIFFEETDGVHWGLHKSLINDLAAEYDWTWDSNYIYIYSSTNPNTEYASVEVPQRKQTIDLNNKEYLHFDGFDLFYPRWTGFSYDWSYDMLDLNGLIIENSEIGYLGSRDLEVGYGTEIIYSDMIIRNNTIHDCGRRGLALDMYGYDFTAENILIEGNEFSNGSHTTGLDIDVGASSFNASLNNITIRNNLFYEISPTRSSDYGSNLVFIQNNNESVTSISNISIYNNIFKYANGYGVLMEGVQSVYIYNNVFYEGNEFTSGAHISAQGGSYAVVKNNIFYTNYSVGGAQAGLETYNQDSSYVTANFNLYYNTNIYTTIVSASGIGSYGISDWEDLKTDTEWEVDSPGPADPLFVNPANNDFRLQAGSPAIDAGIHIPGITDGYQGDAPDIGTYEYRISDN